MIVSLPDIVRQKVALTRDRSPGRGTYPFYASAADGTFYVYGDEYHCFACGAHGDVISFLMQTEGMNFPIAVALLAGAVMLVMTVATVARNACRGDMVWTGRGGVAHSVVPPIPGTVRRDDTMNA